VLLTSQAHTPIAWLQGRQLPECSAVCCRDVWGVACQRQVCVAAAHVLLWQVAFSFLGWNLRAQSAQLSDVLTVNAPVVCRSSAWVWCFDVGSLWW
jgi:hypothetical protein